MAITLTESAARHVAAHLAKRGKGVGLRLGVRRSGCSGFAYDVEYADEVRPDDAEFESHGVRILVDLKSLPMLEGTELDYTIAFNSAIPGLAGVVAKQLTAAHTKGLPKLVP